jgi:peptidyl-prolyl cis-trans isomerase SurA
LKLEATWVSMSRSARLGIKGEVMNRQTRNRLRVGILSVAAGAMLVGACGGAGQAPSADVWAVVDGREISRDDVERAYRRVVDPTQPEGTADEVLISQEILQARAAAQGIAASDAEVDAAYAERTAGLTPEAFQQQLSERGLTPDDLRAAVRRELSVQKLIERDVLSTIQIPDAEVTAFYNENRDVFNLEEPQYRLAQIIVTPERDPTLRNGMNDDAGTPQEASRKVDMLMEKLQSGAEFGTLAADYSEDPQSAPLGGDLGFVPESALAQAPAAMRNVVMETEPGSVSTVTVGGIHTILLVLAKELPGQRELSSPEVREGIREMLAGQREQLLRAAYLAAARNEVDVVNYLAQQLIASQGVPPGLAPAAP